jgi:hypothetical protein
MLKPLLASFLLTLLALPLLSSADAPKSGLASPDRAYIDAVVDGLVTAGALTREQADKIKADARSAAEAAAPAKPPAKKWYDNVKVSGYAIARWQDYLDDTEKSVDASTKLKIGNEFMVRQARTKFDFTPSARTRVEIESDWADEKGHVKTAFIENAWGNAGIARSRFGLQKLPFGFEVAQSSGSRLPFEENYLTKRELGGDYDTGLAFYWTPRHDADLFAAGKASAWAPGDYGTFAIGLFNGQGVADNPWGSTSTGDLNDNKHLIARYTRPFTWGRSNAYGEAGISYWTGSYYSVKSKTSYDDNLLGLHAYLSPAPLGFQAEYFTGETEGADLSGWYAMGLWRTSPDGTFYTRYDKYDGLRKGAGNTPYDRHRTAIGYAHQVDAKTRVTAEYDLEKIGATGKDNDALGVSVLVSY